MHKLKQVLAIVLLLAALFSGGAVLLWATPAAASPSVRPLAANRTVTSTADSGVGTLRQALLDSGVGDVILFDTGVFPPGSPAAINLTSALPVIITNNLTIDGSSAGVILDGSATPGGTDGLAINGASGVGIRGLQIRNFPRNGIWVVNGASQNTIGGTNATPGGACSGNCNVIRNNGATASALRMPVRSATPLAATTLALMPAAQPPPETRLAASSWPTAPLATRLAEPQPGSAISSAGTTPKNLNTFMAATGCR